MKKLLPLVVLAVTTPAALAFTTSMPTELPPVAEQVETHDDGAHGNADALPVFAGYEHAWQQANDAMIVRVVEDFNAEQGWDAGHPDRLDPALVKAWALQESGGHEEIFVSGDMMQMNNAGDWADEKVWFGVERGERLDPEASLHAALKWAYYKGEETRPIRGGTPSAGWYPTLRGSEVLPGYESSFTDWDRALVKYNGGGVADYRGDIERRMSQRA